MSRNMCFKSKRGGIFPVIRVYQSHTNFRAWYEDIHTLKDFILWIKEKFK